MSASDATEIRRALLAGLEHEPRVNLHGHTLEIDYAEGTATLSGEVADIAAKRLTLELAAALADVAGIVDRLKALWREVDSRLDAVLPDRTASALDASN